MDTQIIIAVLTGISALLGIMLTHLYTKNSDLRSELKDKKQVLYADYVTFIYKAYSGEIADQADLLHQMKEYMPKLLSFASNEVVKNAEDFMQHLFKYNAQAAAKGDISWNIASAEYFGDLILAVRNDIGHKKFGQIMKWHDVARLWVRDIDTYVPANERTPRAYHPGPKPRIPPKQS